MNAKEFKQHIEDLNLTQRDLAYKLGITENYISQIVNGRAKPSRRLIRAFELLILSSNLTLCWGVWTMCWQGFM